MENSLQITPLDVVDLDVVRAVDVVEVHSSEGISLAHELTISFVDDEFSDRHRSLLIRYALEVHQFDASIRMSARQLCISLFRCQQAYILGSKKQTTSGWGAFCVRNFAAIGMSDGNMRAAVRTGEALVRHEVKHPEGIELFNRLSRAALFALGGNEETLITVQQVLEATPTEIITASDVRRINEELSKQKILKLEAERRVTELERTNQNLLESAAERRGQAQRWKEAAEAAELKAKTPVEAVVFQLPPGIKSETELQEQLTKTNEELKSENDRLLAGVESTKDKLLAIQTSFNNAEQTRNALDELESDLYLLHAKFPASMVQKMASGTPEIVEKLKSIAQALRALAVVMDVN